MNELSTPFAELSASAGRLPRQFLGVSGNFATSAGSCRDDAIGAASLAPCLVVFSGLPKILDDVVSRLVFVIEISATISATSCRRTSPESSAAESIRAIGTARIAPGFEVVSPQEHALRSGRCFVFVDTEVNRLRDLAIALAPNWRSEPPSKPGLRQTQRRYRAAVHFANKALSALRLRRQRIRLNVSNGFTLQ